MAIDPGKLRQVMDEWFGSQPHAKVPSITRAEYAAHEPIAKLVHGERNPAPQQVEAVTHQLRGAQLSPTEFERVWNLANGLSRRLLGRTPNINEIVHLQNAHPADITQYYQAHPHPKYPEVSAGDMARYYQAAQPIAQQHIGRNPVENEITTFIQGGYTADEIAHHYRQSREPRRALA